MTSENARGLAEYQSAEFHRRLFSASSYAQLTLAGLILFTCSWPPRLSQKVILSLLVAGVMAAVQAKYILPPASEIARLLAFTTEPPPSHVAVLVEGQTRLRSAYLVVEVIKTASLLGCGYWSLPARATKES